MSFLDKLAQTIDRRKQQRRSNNNSDNRSDSAKERRSKKDRREAQRRKLFRVPYPFGAAPIDLNHKIIILDISLESIRFVFKNRQETVPVGDMLELEIKFHDDEMITRRIIVKNCYDDYLSKHQYIGHFTKPLPSDRIGKEQAYVLRNFPDFCRDISVMQKKHIQEVEKKLKEEQREEELRKRKQSSQDKIDTNKDSTDDKTKEI